MLVVKIIAGLMFLCDVVLGRPDSEVTKPGPKLRKVSADKVHNGGRKGPMSGATNQGNVPPIPILIPFPIIPVQGGQGGQVMTPSQGQAQGQGAGVSAPAMGQGGAMNVGPQGPARSKKKRKKKLQKTTDRRRKAEKKISVKKEIKEKHMKEGNKHSVRQGRDTPEGETNLFSRPLLSNEMVHSVGSRESRGVDGERVGYRLGSNGNLTPQMENMLKTLNTTTAPISSLLNSSSLGEATSDNEKENSKVNTSKTENTTSSGTLNETSGKITLDTPKVAVHSIPSLLGALLGKPLSNSTVMYIEKVNSNGGGGNTIPSVNSTLTQNSTLPLGEKNLEAFLNNKLETKTHDAPVVNAVSSNVTDTSKSNNVSAVNATLKQDSIIPSPERNSLSAINTTLNQDSIIPSPERNDLEAYLKNKYPIHISETPIVNAVNTTNAAMTDIPMSSVYNNVSTVNTTLNQDSIIPSPERNDLETNLKNKNAETPVVYAVNTTNATMTDTLMSSIYNNVTKVNTTLNQDSIIPSPERNLETNLKNKNAETPVVNAVNTTNATMTDTIMPSVYNNLSAVHTTLNQDSIIPSPERNDLETYLKNKNPETPVVNVVNTDNVNSNASSISNVTSTLNENTTIPSGGRNNIEAFLINKLVTNTPNARVVNDSTVPDNSNTSASNASVLGTKDTVNDTLNGSSKNDSSIALNNGTECVGTECTEDNRENAGTRSLLNAFLIKAMKDTPHDLAKLETTAEITNDMSNSIKDTDPIPSKLETTGKITTDMLSSTLNATTSSSNVGTSGGVGMSNRTLNTTSSTNTGSRSDMSLNKTVSSTNGTTSSTNTGSRSDMSNRTSYVKNSLNGINYSSNNSLNDDSPSTDYTTLTTTNYNTSASNTSNPNVNSSSSDELKGNTTTASFTHTITKNNESTAATTTTTAEIRYAIMPPSNTTDLSNTTDTPWNATRIEAQNTTSIQTNATSSSSNTDSGNTTIGRTNSSSSLTPPTNAKTRSNATIAEEEGNATIAETVPSNTSVANSNTTRTETDNTTLSTSSTNNTSVTENVTVAEATNTTSITDGSMVNIVSLINNLTNSNWTRYPSNMSSSGDTISSIARLIGSLNGLNEPFNSSLYDNDTTKVNSHDSLLSAGDLNDTILERITNEGNYNDSLLIKLVDYFQAMNLTSDPKPWGISLNDTLRDRIKNYIEIMNTTNVTSQTLEQTNNLLEDAKEFPPISHLLEKGRGILEKQLGTPIDNYQVAKIVNHFINWRDQSFTHKCLRDILNVREVNECFANLMECKENNATKRNVISNLRNFFTCRDRRKLNKNVIVVGNYTMRQQQEEENDLPHHKPTKTNETREEGRKNNKKLAAHKGNKEEENVKTIEKELSDEERFQEGKNTKVKAMVKELSDEEKDCDDSINNLEKCKLKKVQSAAANKTKAIKDAKAAAMVIHDECDENDEEKAECRAGKLNNKHAKNVDKKHRNKTLEDCEDGSDCFKMKLSKFIEEKCAEYDDNYKKCKLRFHSSSDPSNASDVGTPRCHDEHKEFAKCRNKTKHWRKEFQDSDCDPNAKLSARCFIMNHLEATTFSGSIEKADIVKGEKTLDGSRNETTHNETVDFAPGNDTYSYNDTYTMQNETTYRACEGCLNNHQNNNDTDNFLSFNAENSSSLLNTSSENEKSGEGTFLKKFEITKTPVECANPSLFEMWQSQDDDDRDTAKHECFGSIKRGLISKHVTTHNKQTAGNGTVTKDKTTDGTKVTDDEGREVKQQNKETKNSDEHTENHKVLDDILSGKYIDDIKKGMEYRTPESSENRTIPIDPSMLPQKDPDPNNPDAGVGIVGKGTEPAIEKKVEEPDKNNTKSDNDKVKDKDEKNDASGKEAQVAQDNEKDEKGSDAKGEYWLHGVNSDKTTNPKDKDEEKEKERDKNAKRILCFGDSLTKGFYHDGKKYHPYSIKLESLLKEDGVNAKVINHGVNGECVALEMQRRLAKDLEELPKLDLVVILGGTNDLLNLDCVRKLDLFQEIKNLHVLVRAKGYKSVIVTIPEAKSARLGTDTMSLIEYRKELDTTNQRLRMYAIASKLPIIDLADSFTRHSVNGKTNASTMWDDDIHPSREGYDKIGELIYEKVKHIL